MENNIKIQKYNFKYSCTNINKLQDRSVHIISAKN